MKNCPAGRSRLARPEPGADLPGAAQAYISPAGRSQRRAGPFGFGWPRAGPGGGRVIFARWLRGLAYSVVCLGLPCCLAACPETAIACPAAARASTVTYTPTGTATPSSGFRPPPPLPPCPPVMYRQRSTCARSWARCCWRIPSQMTKSWSTGAHGGGQHRLWQERAYPGGVRRARHAAQHAQDAACWMISTWRSMFCPACAATKMPTACCCAPAPSWISTAWCSPAAGGCAWSGLKARKVVLLQDWISSGQLLPGGMMRTRVGRVRPGAELRVFVNDVFQFSVKDPVWDQRHGGCFCPLVRRYTADGQLLQPGGEQRRSRPHSPA